MEPLLVIAKFLAVAWFAMIPAPTSTVDVTTPDVVYVSNVAALSEEPETLKVEPQQNPELAAVPETITQKEGLQLPLPAGVYEFSDNFGPRCLDVPGASRFHKGIDLAAPYGTPIYAISSGTITKVVDGHGDVGGTVVLQATINGETVSFFYHHMEVSSTFVQEGQQVTAGQQISTVASTGVSSGNHLHLEVWLGGYPGGTQSNPEPYFQSINLPVIQNAGFNTVTEDTSCLNTSEGPKNYDTGSTPKVSTPPAPAPAQPSAPAKPSTPEPTQEPSKPTPTPTQPPVVTPTPEPTKPAEPAKPEPTPEPTQAPSSPSPAPVTPQKSPEPTPEPTPSN